MGRSPTEKRSALKANTEAPHTSPFKIREDGPSPAAEKYVHLIRPGVRCDTEKRGYETPSGKSPAELVVDASQGFIPLWEKGTILRWRFQESSFVHFENPRAAQSAVQVLFGKAVLAWGDAAPVKFSMQNDAWDFEIIVRQNDDCNLGGCVLASAFFPDSGQHKLHIYPKMFEQSEDEQIDTLIHEIGHIFGLRHFFAQISETKWASEVFGEHQKFTIMNYGTDSHLTASDKSDLKKLYELAWAGILKEINGTQIKFVRPFHRLGQIPNNLLVASRARAVLVPDDPYPFDPFRNPEPRRYLDETYVRADSNGDYSENT